MAIADTSEPFSPAYSPFAKNKREQLLESKLRQAGWLRHESYYSKQIHDYIVIYIDSYIDHFRSV
jgi:hypothetical protein